MRARTFVPVTKYQSRIKTMLVISRKLNEKLFLTMPDGRVIDIIVTRTTATTAKLSVNAPQDVRIVRDDAKKTA